MTLSTAFADVKGFFKKVFTKAVPAEAAALSVLNTLAPDVEIVLDLVDPAAGELATPIITEIQADMGTVAGLLKSGNTATVGSFLVAIKSNLGLLLSAGHISNPASVTKATGIVGAISGVIGSLLAQYPAAA